MSLSTKAFKNGHSQPVRIPAKYRYAGTDIELEIERVGEELRIRPAKRKLTVLPDKFSAFPADMFEGGRPDDEVIERESF